MIKKALENFPDVAFEYIQKGPGGYLNVFVTFSSTDLSIGDRGQRLLEIESILIKNVDSAIRVWHVPIGDKNSLRKLRGVILK